MTELEKTMYELIMEIYKGQYWASYDTSKTFYQVEVDKGWFKRVEELDLKNT